ncbi:hypothetical protein MVES_002975 [Malassezia vespertilionis]|uniref:Tes1p n=1 Tax=Malassezia vespertilionis TaxID=2020962 RepID=A0A2N1J9U3_9BASI|nr:hypothetical protein MVES_002975 [Malassezia vespertilionis]
MYDSEKKDAAYWAERMREETHVRHVSGDVYESVSPDVTVPFGSRSIFGGVLLGQAINAASATMPEKYLVQSMQVRFLDTAKRDRIQFTVTSLRSGRSYILCRVEAHQHGRFIFTSFISFKVPDAPDTSYAIGAPIIDSNAEFEISEEVKTGTRPAFVLPPEESMPGNVRYEKGLANFPDIAKLEFALKGLRYDQLRHPAEYRVAVPTMYNEMSLYQFGSKLALWVRARGDYHEDENHQRAALAYYIDLDHSMWFYESFSMSDWLLLVMEPQSVADGRTLVLGRIYRQDGVLVAVAIQEGVFRQSHNKALM